VSCVCARAVRRRPRPARRAPPAPAPTAPASTPAPASPPAPAAAPLPPAETIRSDDPRVEAILAERRRLDETVWADELLAQDHERTIIDMWDRLRGNLDAITLLGAEPATTVVVGSPGPPEVLEGALTSTPLDAEPTSLDADGRRKLAQQLVDQKYRLVESEWHHTRFEPRAEGGPRSTFGILLHVVGPRDEDRTVIKGDIVITWEPNPDASGLRRPRTVDATGLRMLRWDRAPVFQVARVRTGGNRTLKPPTMPIIAWDLDGDSRSELILPRGNEAYFNRGEGAFERRTLVAHEIERPVESIKGALVADLTGDGAPDLLVAREGAPMALWEGARDGSFPSPPRLLEVDGMSLTNPQALTAGDVDGDGDLDLWVAQYLEPYQGGRMPTPYYDANDGLPSYFLENLGGGRFVDRTEAAGLTAKRHRRTYSTSLVDLDADGDLDLLTVNDFAGFDTYANDGAGHFRETSPPLAERALAFGMAHTFGDFNRDGLLDFLVIGMSSSTARRLDALGLGRPAFEDHQTHRLDMGYGNRLMLGAGGGAFREAEGGAGVARSGWSWGTSAFDADADGDLDIYIANGHTSGSTAADYCTTFWRQDIYSGAGGPDPALAEVYAQNRRTLDSGAMSWNGFEHNHLFINLGAKGFVNVAFLAGVAFEFDARAVLTDDFDLDGRPDLVVTREVGGTAGLDVIVARNNWPVTPRFVGVRVSDAPGHPAIGATVRVRTSRGVRAMPIVAGDSYRAQHAAARSFALSPDETVEAIEASWPDGLVRRIDSPALGQYHALVP
jgi:hypothetical protein